MHVKMRLDAAEGMLAGPLCSQSCSPLRLLRGDSEPALDLPIVSTPRLPSIPVGDLVEIRRDAGRCRFELKGLIMHKSIIALLLLVTGLALGGVLLATSFVRVSLAVNNAGDKGPPLTGNTIGKGAKAVRFVRAPVGTAKFVEQRKGFRLTLGFPAF